MIEKDPHGKDQHQLGAKMDAGKSPVFQGLLDYFPRACKAVADVSAAGAKKYAWKGWETVPDGINRYRNALGRHLVDESIDGVYDRDGFRHLAQQAWNALAALELTLRKEEDVYSNSNVSDPVSSSGIKLCAGSVGGTLRNQYFPPDAMAQSVQFGDTASTLGYANLERSTNGRVNGSNPTSVGHEPDGDSTSIITPWGNLNLKHLPPEIQQQLTSLQHSEDIK